MEALGRLSRLTPLARYGNILTVGAMITSIGVSRLARHYGARPADPERPFQSRVYYWSLPVVAVGSALSIVGLTARSHPVVAAAGVAYGVVATAAAAGGVAVLAHPKLGSPRNLADKELSTILLFAAGSAAAIGVTLVGTQLTFRWARWGYNRATSFYGTNLAGWIQALLFTVVDSVYNAVTGHTGSLMGGTMCTLGGLVVSVGGTALWVGFGLGAADD